jgi:hypothetical protein
VKKGFSPTIEVCDDWLHGSELITDWMMCVRSTV